ncbi:hypothetical protein IR083_00875 [Dysgonomonas sp. GY75]|uniref:hypothetical protein n=1 Tax=Dysgonomonas sp. GY75 TaxID=2780419 RepID=UPI0018838AC8|nr:hypothetical protein [Dysgonomonas sp. GY75]MBF0647372.1 hypothetical protein [Dysgonomonas sp. GY75]
MLIIATISSINNIGSDWFNFVLAKTKDWEYEKEYRLAIEKERLRKNPVRFEKNCLKGIIFWVNTNDADIAEIQTICDNNYDNIVYYKAIIRERKIEIKNFNIK